MEKGVAVRGRLEGRTKIWQTVKRLVCSDCEYGRTWSCVVAPEYLQSGDALVIEDEVLYSAKIHSLKD